MIEKHNQKPLTSDIKDMICGYITKTPDTQTPVSEILKNWDLLDVKTYSDILTSQLSQQVIVETPVQLKSVMDGSASKFNNYALGDLNRPKRLPLMDTNLNCT